MKKRHLLLPMMCLLLNGCASIIERMTQPETGQCPRNDPKYIYPGVALDTEVLSEAIHPKRCVGAFYNPMGLIICLISPLSLIDLPLSFTLDTVCLPYDYYMVTAGGMTRAGRFRIIENGTVRGILSHKFVEKGIFVAHHEFEIGALRVLVLPSSSAHGLVSESQLLQVVGKEVVITGELDRNQPHPHILAHKLEIISDK